VPAPTSGVLTVEQVGEDDASTIEFAIQGF